MSLSDDTRVPTRFDTRFVLGPNASLSVRGAWLFMGLASVGTLGCAAYCTWLGLWPVLPFAGLELAALGWALLVSMRRNGYREVVSFTGGQVRIEFGVAGRGASLHIELPRAWTRVCLEHAGRRNAPTLLVLSSSGQRVIVGRCLTDEEREQLAERFNRLLRAARSERGALPTDTILGERIWR